MRIAPLTPEDAAILDRLFVRRPHLVITSTRADAEGASAMAERMFLRAQRRGGIVCSCEECHPELYNVPDPELERGDYVPAVCDANGAFLE